MSDPLSTARHVLELEIAGLAALRDSLNGDFTRAVELCRNAQGRIIVTGMGKSGHVGRKIASTLSSTGAPASYVHPGEASHGDLGMISPKDIILALSKSGETPELGDLLAYASRHSIPVIAVTSAPASTLAKAASLTIPIPTAAEACSETRAPTTSTTMMVALGDALAVALLRARGFTADDFKGFHPGGNLGAALRRVRDLMHGADRLPLISADAPMVDAVRAISHGGFGCVGVKDKAGALVGVITDGDLRRRFGADIAASTAGDVMTRNPRVTTPDAIAGDILAIMSRDKITAIFVVEGASPVGIVHVHDCLSTGVL